jgi:hypothetical protein
MLGTCRITGIEEGKGAMERPIHCGLFQNVPNPFNAETEIGYALPEAGYVRLCLYDLRGGQVKVLVEGNQAAGKYTVRWNGRDEEDRDLASGVYVYQLEAHAHSGMRRSVRVRKAVLVR